MSEVSRSITYRLYPNKGQEMKMNHFLDCTRKAYNRLVEICKTRIEHNLGFPSDFELIKMATKIRQRNEEMQDVHSQCFQSVAKRVHSAFVRWAKGWKNGTGFPRFKSWKRFDSFKYSYSGCFSFVGKDVKKGKRERIRLGMIGLLKYSNPYVIKGECKTATVFRRKIGNHFEWYVAISFVYEDYGKDTTYVDPLFKRKDVGIDLGLDNLVSMSDGKVIPNDHTYRKKEKELSKIQRRLSGYEENTLDYQKQQSKLTHIFKRLRNHRNDLYHKITRSLSERYANIYMEDLPVKEMVEDSFRGMRKSYRDASWSIITKMICYKAAEAGSNVVFVSPAYTSQLCSSCGTMVPKDLSVREHNCPNCGLKIPRDENAAINILNRGLRLQTEAGKSLKCHDG